MKKGLMSLGLAMVLVFSSAVPALAGTWVEETGKWYYLDDSGSKSTGLVTDGVYTYLLGADGVMITEDGVYENLTLTFNHEHNGFFGAIVSGLEEKAGEVSLNLPEQPSAVEVEESRSYNLGRVSNGVSGVGKGSTGLMN